MGPIGFLLTVIIFINTAIAAHVTTAYSAPMASLSAPKAAKCIWWYGYSMLFLMFLAAGWGLYILIFK